MTNLKEVIDLKLWEEIQNNFVSIIPCEITTLNLYGEEIISSNKNYKFINLIRESELGELRYKEKLQEQLGNIKDEDIIFYHFPNNMLNILVPIIIEGVFFGAIKCGPIVKRPVNIQNFSRFAREIDVDNNELTNAFNEIKQLNEEEIKNIAMLLLTLSKIMPKITLEKQRDTRTISELTILTKINNMINETLDLNKILKYITKFMVNSIKGGKNCSIFMLDENNNLEIKSTTGLIKNFNEEELLIQKTITEQAVESKSTIIIKDASKKFDKNNLRFNSIMAIPLKIRENVIGSINLSGHVYNISENDLNFLNVIATQTVIAIENSKLYEETKKKAITDHLTRLYNKAYFMETFRRELIRTEKSKTPISFMILDIDDFKHYNDTNGHIPGDLLLKEFANILLQNVRKTDIVGRYGGEEFMILLVETINKDALVTANRIKESVENYDFKYKEKQPQGKVTVSIGLVTCIQSTLDENQIINKSDKLLYEAKRTGKNKIFSNVIINDKDYDV